MTIFIEKMEKIIFRLKCIKSFQVFTIFVRYLLGIAFVWASILKIKGIRFEPQSGEDTPFGSLSHPLEAMYRSGFYCDFIGWGQLIAGLLIVSQIFSTLGAVVYFPIMLSIFVLTTAFEGPIFLKMTSSMLLTNVYLLLWDWNKLKFIILNNPGPYTDQNMDFSRKKIWTHIGVVMGAVVIIFRIISTR